MSPFLVPFDVPAHWVLLLALTGLRQRTSLGRWLPACYCPFGAINQQHRLNWLRDATLRQQRNYSRVLPDRKGTRRMAAIAWSGTKAPNLKFNDPIFRAASSSMRRLGTPTVPPVDVTKSGNESSGQHIRSTRPTLAFNYTAHVAG